MIRRVFESVEKTWHTLASHESEGQHAWDSEHNLYKKEILICASHLGDGVDAELKIAAIQKMGHLAYTGSADAARCAGSYLETLANLFKEDPKNPLKLRVQVAKSLSELCRAHWDNCREAAALGLIPLLAASVTLDGDPRLVRWACYALVVLCSSGASVLRSLIDYSDNVGGDLWSVTLEELEDRSWKGWPRNYAAVLRDFLGHVTVDLNSQSNISEDN